MKSSKEATNKVLGRSEKGPSVEISTPKLVPQSMRFLSVLT